MSFLCSTVAPIGPAGSIFSNAEDMARWIQFHLAVISRTDGRGGTPVPYPGTSGLTEAEARQVAQMYVGQMPYPKIQMDLLRPDFPVSDVHTAYSMGWAKGAYRGEHIEY